MKCKICREKYEEDDKIYPGLCHLHVREAKREDKLKNTREFLGGRMFGGGEGSKWGTSYR